MIPRLRSGFRQRAQTPAKRLNFITCSCYQRQPLLGSATQMRQRYEFVVLGYVVMLENVHLLMSEPDRGNPSIVMQAVKLGFARRVKRGLVAEPEQWPWSSFRAYIYGELGVVRLNEWQVLKMKVRSA